MASGALSVAEDFFEIDLAKALGWPGHDLDIFDLADKRLIGITRLSAIVELLRDADVPQSKVDEILREAWHRYVEIDYADAVLGNNTIPDGTEYKIIEEWNQLRRARAATPEELKAFIEKIGDQDLDRLRFLEAYEFYNALRKHKDFELWKRRHEAKLLAFFE